MFVNSYSSLDLERADTENIRKASYAPKEQSAAPHFGAVLRTWAATFAFVSLGGPYVIAGLV